MRNILITDCFLIPSPEHWYMSDCAALSYSQLSPAF